MSGHVYQDNEDQEAHNGDFELWRERMERFAPAIECETMETTTRMTLGFDPLSDPETVMVFGDHLATQFYLLWRRSHIVTDNFPGAVNRIVRRLRQWLPPFTADVVFDAIKSEISGTSSFSYGDAQKFSTEVLPYLNGSAEIKWKKSNPDRGSS